MRMYRSRVKQYVNIKPILKSLCFSPELALVELQVHNKMRD